MDDYPAIVLGSVLCDLLAGELHGLLVIAIAVHGGEAYVPTLRSKRYSIVVLYGPKGYLCCGSTIIVALQGKEEMGRETIIQATSTKKRNTNTDPPAFLWQIQIAVQPARDARVPSSKAAVAMLRPSLPRSSISTFEIFVQ